MARYAIWDKKSDIYTPGADQNGISHWTAEDYIASHASWAAIPTVKVIIGGGPINGTCFMEYSATVNYYKRQGVKITDDMTDEEVLAAIEEFEDTPPVIEPSAEERIAATLEYQMMMTLPDEEEV